MVDSYSWMRRGSTRAFVAASVLSLTSFRIDAHQLSSLTGRLGFFAQKQRDQQDFTLRLIAKDESAELGDPEKDHKKKMEGIKKKYDAMGDFLEIMFVLSCRAKHKTDVHGLAAHKLRKDGLTLDEFNTLKKDIQAKNLVELKEACGMIVAQGKKSCRLGCATKFNAALKLRNTCDGKCVESYKNFESGCMSKAKDLQEVYEAEMKKQMAMQKCFTDFCEHFPTVTTMEEDKQKEEVDKRCEDYCDADKISMRCESKVRFDAGFWGGAIKDTCWGKEDLKGCLDEKKKDVNPDDMKPEEYKKALAKAQGECEKASEESMKKCEAEEYKKREEDAQKECEEKSAPECDKDCHKLCEVDRMNACIGKLNTEVGDATEDYCTEMWKFLHESSGRDPVNGMPIVLVQPGKGTNSTFQ